MFESTCVLPLHSELFAQSIHPISPLLALGLASGHVLVDRLPASGRVENGQRCIATAWKTRRHKGSCRCLTFSTDGDHLFSAGSDGLGKCARTEDGRVVSKIAVPQYYSEPDAPTLITSPTPQHLLLATDASALHLYDLRLPSITAKPSQTYNPHADYVTSLTPLPANETSTLGLPRQFLTTGGSTIAIIDLRKGVILESDDFDEELLCSTIVDSKTIVGSEQGVLRIWETGKWEAPPKTYHVGSDGVEAIAAIPDTLEATQRGNTICGMEDGNIKILRLGEGMNRLVGEVSHDQIDAPSALGFLTGDGGGRMISGGGKVIKVWEEKEVVVPDKDRYANGSAEDSVDDTKGEDEEEENSEEEKRPQRRRKKSKRSKSKDKRGNHGVMAFKGMA